MKIFNSCKKYFKKHKRQLILFSLFAFITQFLAFITPYLLGSFLDGLVLKMNMEFVIKYCILYAVVTIFALGFQYLTSLTYCKLQTKMGYEYNKDIIFHIQDLPISFLKGKNISQMNRQINDDANSLIIFGLSIFNQLIINFLSLPILFFICFKLNSTVTIFYMFYCLVYIVIYHIIKTKRYKISYKLLEDKSKFFSKLFEQLDYINFIKSHGIEKFFRKKVNTPFSELYKSSISNQKFEYFLASVDNLLSMVAQVTLFFIGAIQVLAETFTIGNFFIFLNYFAMIKISINYFYNFGAYYQQTLVAHHRINQILDETIESSGNIELEHIDRIEIENLNLAFDNEHIIFTSFCTQFKKGIIYGISGRNGLGKTTLIKIIMGLLGEKVERNTVKLNGIDIKDVNTHSLRHNHIAYVDQKSTLMDESIINNILLDMRTDNLSSIHDFSNTINMKSFVFGDNSKSNIDNLSGGERQKICILRTFFKDANLLILDEPTSALDSECCKIFMQYLHKIKNNKIIIIVSHDDYVIEKCDTTVSL